MSNALRIWMLLAGAGLSLASLALAAWARQIDVGTAWSVGAAGLLLIVVLAVLVRRRERRWDAAAEEAMRALRTLGHAPPAAGMAALHLSVDALQERLAEADSRLREVRLSREAAEAALRESEERYALAVRGADDGMWDWNLKRGQMHFSPRWKALLGYAEDALSDRAEEWFDRIHPEDRERVMAELKAHVDGVTGRFESEHRLRHQGGQYRWVLARGAAIRDAAGRAQRVVGLHTDITARRQVQESLIEVADSLSTLRGEACLRELARRFAEVLGVREVFVTECCNYQPTTRLRMLARWDGGDFARCVEFDMAGTSCEEVIRSGRTLYVPEKLADRWPAERQYRRDSYLGLPCIDARGRVIGNIACADSGPMRPELPHLAILKIFALRATIELERRRLEGTAPLPQPAPAPDAAPPH